MTVRVDEIGRSEAMNVLGRARNLFSIASLDERLRLQPSSPISINTLIEASDRAFRLKLGLIPSRRRLPQPTVRSRIHSLLTVEFSAKFDCAMSETLVGDVAVDHLRGGTNRPDAFHYCRGSSARQ